MTDENSASEQPAPKKSNAKDKLKTAPADAKAAAKVVVNPARVSFIPTK